jgi:hypothetical protein
MGFGSPAQELLLFEIRKQQNHTIQRQAYLFDQHTKGEETFLRLLRIML